MACSLALFTLLSACGGEPPAVTSSFKALGESVDMKLIGVDPARAQEAAELIRQDFATLDHDLNTWSDGSMATVNRMLPTGETFAAPASVLPLVHLSQRYAELSGGLFNPALGKLVALWGFNVEVPEGMRPPPDHAIGQLLKANPRMSDIHVDGAQMQGRNSSLRLDFSPLIRAYAIDVAIVRLRQLDVHDAQVQSGTDLRVIGTRRTHPWRVSIPRGSGAGVFATLNIRDDESLVTRAAHDRDWIYQGESYHHILDPRTGRPARGAQSVTVLDRDATVGAAAAIALFVAGPEDWHRVAQGLGIRYAVLVDGEGRVHLNPELYERIQIVDRDVPIEMSPPLGVPDQSAAIASLGSRP